MENDGERPEALDARTAWLSYTLIRLAAFVLPVVLVVLAVDWEYDWLLGVVIGALISLLVSYIFLDRQRRRIAADVQRRRHRRDPRTALDREEDAQLDEQ